MPVWSPTSRYSASASSDILRAVTQVALVADHVGRIVGGMRPLRSYCRSSGRCRRLVVHLSARRPDRPDRKAHSPCCSIECRFPCPVAGWQTQDHALPGKSAIAPLGSPRLRRAAHGTDEPSTDQISRALLFGFFGHFHRQSSPGACSPTPHPPPLISPRSMRKSCP